MKKTIAFLMSALIALILIAGCAQKPTTTLPAQETAVTSAPSEETTPPEPTTEETEEDISVDESTQPEFEDIDVDLGDVY